MNGADLQTLVDYHYWARDRMLEALDGLTQDQWNRDVDSSFRSIRETAGHLYFAEWAWHERWEGRVPSGPPVTPFHDVAELRRAWTELEREVRAFLQRLGDDVDRVCEYRLLSGQPGASTFAQMVQHVVNHASYHRGQLTTMIRLVGGQPPKPMDVIAYHRLKSAPAR
ncbi:MAG: DinB family protein [Vicinamibacterales bacterium]